MHTSARASAGSPRAVPAPAIVQQTFHQNFLADVRIDHGPRQLLSRLFLRGDTLLRERGINLQFAPIETLLEVNRQNQDSWRTLFPVFDAELGAVNASNSFALIGREASGRVIAAQGARLYRLGNRTFKQETDSLRLYYPDPERQALPGESCVITAPSAETFAGDLIFSGAVWYHPTYRRQGLTSILPRITKALSLTRWGCDITLSFMVDKVVEGGTAPRAGYRHVEWEVLMKNTMFGDARLALIWSNADELINYFSGLLTPPEAKVDTIIDQGAPHNNPASVAQG
ncbi:MAG: hypothetical protein ACK4TL_13595 [Hyphomicrobiaceae bacterium]